MTPTPRPYSWPPGEPEHRRIPFEYSFEFDFGGRPETLKKTVAVSVEGGFRASSIGYGFIAAAPAVEFGPSFGTIFFGGPGQILRDLRLGDILDGADKALRQLADFRRDRSAADTAARVGIQLNPDLADFALQGSPLPDRALSRLFRIAGNATGEVLFRYALFDGGTGRAFQSEPILNIAGLGTSNGERPFRQFSPAIEFAARSTIDLEITPVSNHVGKLIVALQGYKVLGVEGTPTGSSAQIRRRQSRGA